MGVIYIIVYSGERTIGNTLEIGSNFEEFGLDRNGNHTLWRREHVLFLFFRPFAQQSVKNGHESFCMFGNDVDSNEI